MNWDTGFREAWFKGLRRCELHIPHVLRPPVACLVLAVMVGGAAIPSQGRNKKDYLQYGAGLIVNVPMPEREVEQAVEDVAQNSIIRGTKEYNKDEYIAGAVQATSTSVFPAWTEEGKVFYKVREQTLDPRNFRDTSGLGTLAVRYVVQPQGFQNTVLRIDAVFVDEFRHSIHQSNGSVEGSEYKAIHDHLEEAELVKKETAAALEAKQQQRMAKDKLSAQTDSDRDTVLLSTPPADAVDPAKVDPTKNEIAASSAPAQLSSYDASSESLEQHLAALRREVERMVKKPGAPLKSAPFHSASTLKSLDPGAEVLILVSTPYWYGIETRDGQHGWLQRDQLEQVP